MIILLAVVFGLTGCAGTKISQCAMPVYADPLPPDNFVWEQCDDLWCVTDRNRELLELWEMRLMHTIVKYRKAATICNGRE